MLETYLVHHPVPRKPGIVHNDMDLAVAKLGRLLHQVFDVAVLEQVAYHGDGAVGRYRVDGVGD